MAQNIMLLVAYIRHSQPKNVALSNLSGGKSGAIGI